MSKSGSTPGASILDCILSAHEVASAGGPRAEDALQRILTNIPRLSAQEGDYALEAAQFVARTAKPGSDKQQRAKLLIQKHRPAHRWTTISPKVTASPKKYANVIGRVGSSLKAAERAASRFTPGSAEHASLMSEISYYKGVLSSQTQGHTKQPVR